jgi:hypothetical protein
LLLGALLAVLTATGHAAPASDPRGVSPAEYQVKAVFVLNFSRFVAWPPGAFNRADQPFVIGVLGDDPFGPHLEQAVRGERIDAHPLIVRHFSAAADVTDCQILFIDRSEAGHLDQIVTALDHRSTLTVSDVQGASRRGVMIQFDTQDHRIRLRINAASAHAAGLLISAPLLQIAQIDHTGD